MNPPLVLDLFGLAFAVLGLGLASLAVARYWTQAELSRRLHALALLFGPPPALLLLGLAIAAGDLSLAGLLLAGAIGFLLVWPVINLALAAGAHVSGALSGEDAA